MTVDVLALGMPKSRCFESGPYLPVPRNGDAFRFWHFNRPISTKLTKMI